MTQSLLSSRSFFVPIIFDKIPNMEYYYNRNINIKILSVFLH